MNSKEKASAHEKLSTGNVVPNNNNIKKIKKGVAWSGYAKWKRWQVDSSVGARIHWTLPGRDDLKPFDQAAKITRKKAGQRYVVAVNNPEVEDDDSISFEAFFAGSSWTNSAGAVIKLGISEEDLDTLRENFYCDDEGHGDLFLVLVELDDQDEIVNQERARKGGPKSQYAARLCRDDGFMLWVGEQSGYTGSATFEECDAFIKRWCGIGSKIDLDYNDWAWDRFEKMRSKFFDEVQLF